MQLSLRVPHTLCTQHLFWYITRTDIEQRNAWKERRQLCCVSDAHLAQSAERKALNLVVMGLSPMVGDS